MDDWRVGREGNRDLIGSPGWGGDSDKGEGYLPLGALQRNCC